MAGSPRLGISSSSSDGSNFPGYWNGQHSHFSSASDLERSSSFQENFKSRILTDGANVPRSSTSLHGGNLPLSQVLLLDTLSLGYEKYRHPELKRVTNAVVGTVAEDPSLGPVQAKPLSSLGVEELKRLKGCVTESSLKARERIIFLNEAINKLDKYHRPMLPRKKPQTELSAPNLLFSVDRYALGGNLVKAWHPNHTASNCADLGSQRPDKKKHTVPNKRVRTSMMDMGVEGRPNNLMNGIQQRPSTENCSKPSEGHGFRSNVSDQKLVASPTKITKGKGSRAPHSGSGASVNSSAHVSHMPPTFDSWERNSNLNSQITGGAKSHKRPFSTGSSSIPVAQWSKQKPPKHQRTKRTNSVPLVSNQDNVPDSTESNGKGFLRCSSNNNVLQQSRLKTENISSLAAFSESEKSGAGDKFKDTNKKQGDADKKLAPVCQKVGSFFLPPKKTKAVIKEESGDGVWRQGRSGRTSTHLRVNAPRSGKLENLATTKHLRSRRLGTDKVVSKTGRHPTKKTSIDREPVTQPKRPMNNRLPDFTGELDDDHEELLAAVNAAINASDVACSRPLWKKMEPFFASITQHDLDFLKQLVREVEDVDMTPMSPSGSNQTGKVDLICSSLPVNPSPIILSKQRSLVDGCVDSESLRSSSKLNAKEDIERPGKLRYLDRIPSLSQRLLSALIVEEDSVEANRISCDGPQDDCVHYTSEDSPCGNCTQIESETENTGKLELDIEPDMEMKNWKHHMLDDCNYDSHFTNEHQNHMAENSCSDDFRQDDIVVHSEILGFNGELRGLDERCTHEVQKNQNDFQSNCQTFGLISGIAAFDIQSQDMDLDQRILLELQSIGLFPEPVPDLAQREDGEIKTYICKLKDELQQQVSKNKHHVCKLEKAVLKEREVEERECEVLAMNKLVESAYNRHMGLRGTNGFRRKSARNKVTKQASLDFVKRTLAKCRMFEETGKSCFSDTSLKERMLSISSKTMDKKLGDNAVEGKTADVLAKNAHSLSDIKTSANCTVPSEQAAHIIDQHTPKLENGERELCNTMQGAASFSEQNVVKDDMQPTSMKKRELLFENVNGSGILSGAAALGTTLLGGTKGKRTEKDRDSKVHTQEILNRSGSSGSGQPGLGNSEVGMKDKLKKTAQLSAAANDLGKPAEAQKPLLTLNYREKPSDKIVNLKDELPASQNFIAGDDGTHDNAPIDFSHLQLPNMEYFNMGGQGQDLSSWLNFEDDDSPDAADDLMGLDVPMDDLADLNMF